MLFVDKHTNFSQKSDQNFIYLLFELSTNVCFKFEEISDLAHIVKELYIADSNNYWVPDITAASKSNKC